MAVKRKMTEQEKKMKVLERMEGFYAKIRKNPLADPVVKKNMDEARKKAQRDLIQRGVKRNK